MNVGEICQAWIDEGLGDECFWESWPECPTPEDTLSPRMIMDYIKKVNYAALDASIDLQVALNQLDNVRSDVYALEKQVAVLTKELNK